MANPTAKPFLPPIVEAPADPMPPEPVAQPAPQLVAVPEELAARERAVAAREKALDAIADDGSKVTQANIDQMVVAEYSFCAYDALKDKPNINPTTERALKCATICVLILRNGYVLVGESVCAAPDNYDAAAGRTAAIEDAKRQLWAHENYVLKTRMSGLLVAPDYERRRQEYREMVGREEAKTAPPTL